MRMLRRQDRSIAVRCAAAGSAFGLEGLEARVVLAAVSWDGGGGNGLWSNALNWSGDALPTQADDVTIEVPGVQRTVIVDAGPVRVKSLTVDDTLVVNSGITLNVTNSFDLTANADLRITGLVNWGSGEWASTRNVRVNAGGLLNIGSTVNPGTGSVTLNANVVNAGRLAWRGGSVLLNEGFTLTNNAAKLFDIASPMALEAAVGPAVGTLVNNGLIRRGGLSTTSTTLEVSVVNTDRITILRGTLLMGHNGDDLVFPQFTNSGRVTVQDPASEFDVEMVSTHTGATFQGAGSVRLRSAATLQAATGIEFSGAVAFNAGSTLLTSVPPVRVPVAGATFTGRATFDGVGVNMAGDLEVAGELSGFIVFLGSGDLTVSGTLNLLEIGAVRVPGTILPGGSLIAGGPSSPATVGFTELLTVQGSLILRNGNMVLGEGSQISVAAGGLFRIESQGTGVEGPGAPIVAGTVTNLGTLFYDGETGTTCAFEVTLDNRGEVEVEGGTLDFSGGGVEQMVREVLLDRVALTAGTWIVAADSTLTLAEPLSTADFVQVLGSEAVVELRGAGARLTNLEGDATNDGLDRLSGRLTIGDGLTALDTRPVAGSLLVDGTLQKVGSGGTTLAMAIEQGATGIVDVDGGSLNVPGDFINIGTVSLSASGRLNVAGNFTNESDGEVVCLVTSSNFGRITATGDLTINGGTLRATLTGGGFAAGENRSLLSGATRTGTFVTLDISPIGGGLTGSVAYNATSVVLQISA